jgi:hypothetical protein
MGAINDSFWPKADVGGVGSLCLLLTHHGRCLVLALVIGTMAGSLG